MDVNPPNELLAAIREAYQSALQAMAKSGVKACPTVSSDLQKNLTDLQNRLSGEITPVLIKKTEEHVEQELQQWGERTADYLKAKANEAKELMIVLARTAESMGERDQRYTTHFSELTTRLQNIADLDDLTQVRASLEKGVAELKTYVGQMAQDSQRSVAQLRAEVSTYETKLKEVEELASRDGMTNLPNRRSIEERIERRIAHQQTFCVVMLDLNGFKPVNDTYGHLAGDSLLKQFSQELRSN